MADELEKLWSKLKFTEEEDEGIELGSSCTKAAKAVGKNCIVMKILTMRSLNLDTLRKNLRMLWKPNRGLQISETDEEMFLVEFGDGKDKQKVLEMCPWSFEKQLIVLKEFEGELVPRDIVMKHCPFWVQIFNLPLKIRTKETGWAIGSTLGEVLDVDVLDSGVHWGRCLRVRVSVDISKKLIRGKKINIEGGENRWVIFKYERLPNFCYRCGMLDHAIKECSEGPLVNEGEEEGSFQYGAWLRGGPWKRYGGDTAQFGHGRGQVHWQRNTENAAVKEVEPKRVVGAEQGQGQNGDQALSLLGVNHNASREVFQSSDSQRELGSVSHELGKVNGRLKKVEEKEASLGDDSLGIPSAQPDMKMAMQWEKAEVDKIEAPFKFKLALNKSPTQPDL